MMNSWFKPVVALSILAVPGAAMAAKATVGQPAPSFSLTTYDKRKIKLADLHGKVVVINWWATWCGPCKAEMPMMSAFHHLHEGEGFEIFGVTTEVRCRPIN